MNLLIIKLPLQIAGECSNTDSVLHNAVSFPDGLKTAYLKWQCGAVCVAGDGKGIYEMDIYGKTTVS